MDCQGSIHKQWGHFETQEASPWVTQWDPAWSPEVQLLSSLQQNRGLNSDPCACQGSAYSAEPSPWPGSDDHWMPSTAVEVASDLAAFTPVSHPTRWLGGTQQPPCPSLLSTKWLLTSQADEIATKAPGRHSTL